MEIPLGLVASFIWGTGSNEEMRLTVRLHVERLLEAAPRLPRGEPRLGAAVEVAMGRVTDTRTVRDAMRSTRAVARPSPSTRGSPQARSRSMSRLSRLRERVVPTASVLYRRRFSSDVTAGLSRTSGSCAAAPSRTRPSKIGAVSRAAPRPSTRRRRAPRPANHASVAPMPSTPPTAGRNRSDGPGHCHGEPISSTRTKAAMRKLPAPAVAATGSILNRLPCVPGRESTARAPTGRKRTASSTTYTAKAKTTARTREPVRRSKKPAPATPARPAGASTEVARRPT